MVDILLSTYNGAKHIRQQIDSIINQTYKDWILIIRDDGSSDETLNILNDYAIKYPDKIKVVDKDFSNLGPSKSFEKLLSFTEHDYIMFSDQDDIWLNFKIDVTLNAMHQLEEKYQKMPLLVCTDVTCVNSTGEKIIYKSFFKSRKFIDEALKNDNTFLAMNIVQGCTMMINTLCLKYIIPIPRTYGHDAYIGAVVNHYGKVYYLHKQTMMYRQHETNVYGAPNVDKKYFIHKIKKTHRILKEEQANFNQLPFKASKWKWIIYKIYFSIKRFFL